MFASVSGSGTVTNGQLNVTGTFAPDGLAISGTLNFAASGGQIVLPRTPKRGELVELGTAQAIQAA
ncbi:MAG: hypothetical protein J6V72_03975 [Kiritimatiellae bacterium]|nr:hypothetical protein [Kiritimatiellia bacterium]